MKVFLITLVLIVTFALLLFIRGGEEWDIRRTIPFMGNHPIQLYDFAGAALLFVATIGFSSVYLNRKEPPSTYHANHGDWRPRWSVLIVLAVLAFFMWLAQGIHPAFSWPQLLNAINIEKTQERYSQLASLGVIAISITLIARIGLGHRDDK